MELDIKFLMITWSFIGVNNFFKKTTSKQEGTCGIPTFITNDMLLLC